MYFTIINFLLTVKTSKKIRKNFVPTISNEHIVIHEDRMFDQDMTSKTDKQDTLSQYSKLNPVNHINFKTLVRKDSGFGDCDELLTNSVFKDTAEQGTVRFPIKEDKIENRDSEFKLQQSKKECMFDKCISTDLTKDLFSGTTDLNKQKLISKIFRKKTKKPIRKNKNKLKRNITNRPKTSKIYDELSTKPQSLINHSNTNVSPQNLSINDPQYLKGDLQSNKLKRKNLLINRLKMIKMKYESLSLNTKRRKRSKRKKYCKSQISSQKNCQSNAKEEKKSNLQILLDALKEDFILLEKGYNPINYPSKLQESSN
ncbi:hypothetical protein TUBRATIS_009870 [Tubulinosema ratisbonensis]|uniref:Uncharacterized protein n=1 Tax=Tubulinosema ratisbonensis TaxID=291195 RepID=A0A437AN98_9MICR|nr:hypothetical protein TUBRATIS_009870 [Tubulinosema ratisbonensis]